MSYLTLRHFVALGAVGLVSFGLAITWGRSDSATEPPAVPSVMEVQVAPVRMQPNYTRVRYFTGQVEAAQTSDLSFKRGGKVDELLVDEGQAVTVNQVLARLDTRELKARLRQLNAEVRQAQAKLDELRKGPRDEVIRVAQTEVARLAAEVKLATSRHERTESLFTRNTITKDSFDESRTNLESIQAQHNAALARLEELETGTRTEQIDAQEAMLDSITAARDQVDVELSDSELVAPYAGTISSRRIDPGSNVAAGQSVFHLVEGDRLEFRVGVSEPVANALLTEGESTARISITGYEHPVALERVLPVLNSTTRTRTLIYRFATDSSEHRPVPGQTGELAVAVPIEEMGTWLPNSALVGGIEGLWSCYTLTEPDDEGQGTIRQCDVEILHVESDRSFVRGTMQADDLVVVAGPHRVARGQLARGIIVSGETQR